MTDTRTKILDVAEELIQSVGVNAMSYKHISDVVGIRKASIHHHFPKKDDLVDALLDRCQSVYGANYLEIADQEISAPEKLKLIAKVFEDGLVNNKLCLVGSISTDKNTLQESSCQILGHNIKSTIQIFSRIFSQGQQEQTLKFPGTSAQVAYAFLSFLIGTQIVARAHGGQDAFQQAAEVMIKSFIR